MAYTYEELRHKKVTELREIAAGLGDTVTGYTQMNKEHLLDRLSAALQISRHTHHEPVGLNKAEVKAQLRELKKQRDDALDLRDHARLKDVRRKIHGMKVKLHRAEKQKPVQG